MKFFEELGLFFKNKRKRLRVSLLDIAHHNKTSTVPVFNLEHGKEGIKLDTFFKVSVALDISDEELCYIYRRYKEHYETDNSWKQKFKARNIEPFRLLQSDPTGNKESSNGDSTRRLPIGCG